STWSFRIFLCTNCAYQHSASLACYDDELFGPVASIFRTDGSQEAIRVANSTSFGLGASAWTNDEKERERFIDQLDAGMVFINGIVASDPVVPFGGTKKSGYGRELSYHGIREFINVKTVVIKDPNLRLSEIE